MFVKKSEYKELKMKLTALCTNLVPQIHYYMVSYIEEDLLSVGHLGYQTNNQKNQVTKK